MENGKAWSPHPVLLIAPCFLATFYTLQFFRRYGTTPTSVERFIVTFLIVLASGPRLSLRIVTCALHIVEIDENLLAHSNGARSLVSNPYFVWTIPHTHESLVTQLTRVILFPPHPSRPRLRLTQCHHNVLTLGPENTKAIIQRTRMHYPNILVGIPREKIIFTNTESQKNFPILVKTTPSVPNASTFAQIGDNILPVIRMDHVFIFDHDLDDLASHHPVMELTQVRGPRLGATTPLNVYNFYYRHRLYSYYCEG